MKNPVRSLAVWSCAAVLWLSALLSTSAQTVTFDLRGVSLELQEVTPDTAVFFRSLRLNRALNQWNVEVTVSNRSDRVLSGPLVLLVESYRGTSGPLLADGNLPGATPRAFYDLSGLATGSELVAHQSTSARTLSLGFTTGSPVLVTRVFAGSSPPPVPIGVTRSLNEVGQPLAGTTLLVMGPGGGTPVVQTTDRPSGVASFGDTAGQHVVKFSQEGSLPVWRQPTLSTGSVAVVPNPRLAQRSSRVVDATPLGGSVVTNDSGSVRVSIGAGSFAGSASLRLTSLTGQTLPSFLPPAWSPLQSFHLESSSPLSQGLPASLKPIGPIATSETAALVHWNETTLVWDVVQLVNGRGAEPVDVLLPTSGSFALVVGDAGQLAPPAAVVGQPLPAGSTPVPATADFTATGIVDPSSSPASQVPVRVTGQATVTLRHGSAKLPSGTLVRGDVTESYLLKDGSTRITPSYEQFFVAYQRPGDEDPQTLQASFPMRPLLLFGAEELSAATVRIEVLPLTPFDGRVVDQRGGQLVIDSGRVLVGAGQLSAPTAFRIGSLSLSPFTNTVPVSMKAVGGFEITFDASRLSGPLTSRFEGLTTNSAFVLAKVLNDVGLFGLEPVERLQTDANGAVTSAEPTSGDRLTGIRSSGHYVLIRVGQPQGLISGIARDGKGNLRAGMPVRASGTPWVALTDDQGRFRLVAAVGAQSIEVTDPATGDTGTSSLTVTDPRQSVVQDLASAPAGPRVVAITPANEARKVSVVTPITIQFSEPVNPVTILGGNIQLIGPDEAVISTSVSLNLANRIATLSPGSDLAPGATYKVVLAATIADPSGLKLEGPSQFTFTTAAASTRDASSQLVIYQPGATNVPVAILDQIPAYEAGKDPLAIVVHGTPGTADPEVPVILVNESTGETTTVLSKVDGSFSSVVSGTEEDFVSATFVNLNGTRVYVPVSRQEFDNGFVGLYRPGGILEAQSDGGPVNVIIEPGSVPSKTKVRMKTLSAAQLAEVLQGTTPDQGRFAANAIRLELQGDIPSDPIKVRVAAEPSRLGIGADADPKQAGAILARVREQDGIKTFEVADQMKFVQVPRAAQPPPGRPKLAGDSDENFYWALDTAFGFIPGPVGDIGQPLFSYVVIPMLLSGQSFVVKGKVKEAPSVVAAGDPLGEAAVQAALDATKSQALGGAFVILRQAAVPWIGPPGRLQPGMIHATSDRNGDFLIIAPSLNDAYLLTATHPRFADRPGEPVVGILELGLAGIIFKHLTFHEPLAIQSPPNLSMAHDPVYPALMERCQIQINSSQGSGPPPEIGVLIKSVKRFSDNVELPTSVMQLTDVKEEVLPGARKRWTGFLQATQEVFVTLRVSVQAQNGIGRPPIQYPILFRGQPPRDPETPIPPSDPTEKSGPLVMSSIPSELGYVDQTGEIILGLNEPISKAVEQAGSAIHIIGPGDAIVPVVALSPDQMTLSLRFSGLRPDSTYTLSIGGQAIRDLNGNPLDQRPSTPEKDSFTMTFRTNPQLETKLPGLVNGRGVAISGDRLYALEGSGSGSLVIYSLREPSAPKWVGQVPLKGIPRDLVVIPRYSYRRSLSDTAVYTSELVAVVGGDLDTVIDDLDSVIVPGQYLNVFDCKDPANPVRLATPVVSYRVGSAVVKVQWSAPFLVYQEFGTDVQQIGAVNLQELIIGWNATRAEADQFKPEGTPGKDANGDGDYTDVGDGDELPLPERRPLEFYGKKFALTFGRSNQKVLDFGISGGVVGAVLSSGFELDKTGKPTGPRLNPQYRTISFNGFEPDPKAASVLLPAKAYPKRVSIFDNLPVLVGNTLKRPVVAAVSLTPDEDGVQKIVFYDITLPESPSKLGEVPLPEASIGGFIQSVVLRADGMLEVFTSLNSFVIQPQLITRTNTDPSFAHPALTAFIPGAGAGTRSVGFSDIGLHAVAEGGRASVIQTVPKLSFVYFPDLPDVVRVDSLPANAARGDQLIREMHFTSGLVPARFRTGGGAVTELTPPSPLRHYHVLVEAPGGAGSEITIGLESLNPAGWPLPNRGPGFAPVRALSESTLAQVGNTARPNCDAPIRPLIARRMSDDPLSPNYNRYLSRAFALVYERTAIDELADLTATSDREILWSGAFLRACLDPEMQKNTVLGAFVASVDSDRKRLLPKASATASTLDVGYVMGENAPPAGGYSAMSGTYSSVAGHSGELRTSQTDMSLPSRRMPISINRTIGDQDAYDGPFGLGWDFNYNQRITDLDGSLFPSGLKMPLITREEPSDSVVGGSRDLLFHSGEGRMVLFRWVSDSVPPEYVQDPLVAQLDYMHVAKSYYLPEPGVFDLLVKFQDGRYERLTPEGMRYRYAPNGRLETIIDRYPKNRHELEYDRNGWLIRITDVSVSDDRFLEFGHYRRESDPEFVRNLDEPTQSSFLEGKICRLRDYAGGDVLFFYNDDGVMIRREGVKVAGENGGFSGRPKTHYLVKECRTIGMTVGEEGKPLIATESDLNASRQPVVKSVAGISGAVQVKVPANANASKLRGMSTSSVQPDGTEVTQTYDKWGYPKLVEVKGGGSAPVTVTQEHNQHGQVTDILYPLGRRVTMTYDEANPIFRSRGNVTQVTVAPGAKGGEGYTETYHYDSRYNLASGVFVTADGFSVEHVLSADGRSIVGIKHGGAGEESIDFNEYGQITRTVSHTGIETSYEFDAATGFLLRERNGSATYEQQYDGSYASKMGFPARMIPPSGESTTMEYNSSLQPVASRRGELASFQTYDEQGRPTAVRSVVGGGRETTSTTEYDVRGFVLKSITKGVETETGIQDLTYEFAPDKKGRVSEIRLPDGSKQEFVYDGRGNVMQFKLGGYLEEYTYDAHGNVIEAKVGGKVVSRTEYDGLDRATKITTLAGDREHVESRTYFAGGSMKTYLLTDSKYGILQNHAHQAIDALGRPKEVVLGVGGVVSPTYKYLYEPLKSTVIGPRMQSVSTWNSSGHNISYSDPLKTAIFTPKANGFVSKVESREQGATYHQSFEYDDLDNQTSVSDDLGLIMSSTPRADGMDLSVKNARGNVATFDYTALGEPLSEKRSDGREFRFKRDAQRRVVYVGDPTAGFTYGYDQQQRLVRRTQRDGGVFAYQDFDALNMPATATIPGGRMTMRYDTLRNLVDQTIEYGGTVRGLKFDYDAMGRVREETYSQGTAEDKAFFDYDVSGVLTKARYIENGTELAVTYGYYVDGEAKSMTLPSGKVVQEVRDVNGRLNGISDEAGNIVLATDWQGNANAKIVDFGSVLTLTQGYDARGRMTSQRVTRKADGKVLSHLRYGYDSADNLTVRQWLHRARKADVFGYDSGERIKRAAMAVVPQNASAEGPAGYTRDFTYHPGGLDLLLSASLVAPAGNPVPVFASTWGAHDNFLQPTVVDGFTRGPADALGHVQKAALQTRPASGGAPVSIPATLIHDGQGNLVRIEREDGLIVENRYQSSGLRYLRRILQGAQVQEVRRYLYDGSGRLVEEYVGQGQLTLAARYYYASSDAPIAADLPDPDSGLLRRFYYLRDASMSVIGIADRNGNLMERVWYDVYGQPMIERRDEAPPKLARVVAKEGGRYWLVFSEPVYPAFEDPGPGDGIVTLPLDLAVTVSATGGTPSARVDGTSKLLMDAVGFAPGTVVEWQPATPLPAAATLSIPAKAVMDEWGNAIAATSVTLLAEPTENGTLFTGSSGSTAAEPLARSAVGSPFLFHGQYIDYDTGLYYFRARFYDPYSAMFMEPDPLGYEDSVNLYAGIGNNPVNFRDPSGLQSFGSTVLKSRAGRFLSDSGLTDLEIEAVMNVLAKREQNITLSIRRFVKYGDDGRMITDVNTAAYRRRSATLSTLLKGVASKAKNDKFAHGIQTVTRFVENLEEKASNLGRVWSGGVGKEVNVTSDLDALHVEIDGQFASVAQIRKLFSEINQEFIDLHHKKFAHLGKKAPKPNPPFQHEAHAHLLHQVGNRLGKEATYFKNGILSITDVEKIGHPSDAFVIQAVKPVTATGGRGATRVTAQSLSREDVGGILQRGLDDFLAKRDSLVHEKLFHKNGRPRLKLDGTPMTHRDLRASGFYSIKAWPQSYNTFKDGTPGLPGVHGVWGLP